MHNTQISTYKLDIIPRNNPFRLLFRPSSLEASLISKGTQGLIIHRDRISTLINFAFCNAVHAFREESLALSNLISLAKRIDRYLAPDRFISLAQQIASRIADRAGFAGRGQTVSSAVILSLLMFLEKRVL